MRTIVVSICPVLLAERSGRGHFVKEWGDPGPEGLPEGGSAGEGGPEADPDPAGGGETAGAEWQRERAQQEGEELGHTHTVYT